MTTKTIYKRVVSSPTRVNRPVPQRPQTPRNVPHTRVFPVALPRNEVAITQGFNAPVDYSRLNPNRVQRHEGIDFAPQGSARDNTHIPVVAVENAIVEDVREQQGGYGRYVRLRFDDGRYGALYAHLGDVNVRQGQHVNAGDVLGTMGSTGHSTGRHLHFNLLDLSAGRGNYIYPQVIDPTNFLLSGEDTMVQRIDPQPVSYQSPRATKPAPSPMQTLAKVRVLPQQNTPTIDITNPFNAPEQPSVQELQAASQQGLPPMFQTGDVTSPTLAAYSPSQVAQAALGVPNAILGGIFSQGINPDTGEFDLLQAVGLGTGDEREDYIKQYAPYFALGAVGIVLLLLGAAKVVFGK
jgi:hypothetical protein